MMTGLRRLFGLLLAFAAACAAGQSLAEEQRRLALVIGNNAYENVTKLEKAVSDAEAVTQKLSEIGFAVTKATDIGRRAMSRAVLEFEKSILPGDMVLFYFAGHGFAVSGQNYLLPADIPAAGPGDESLVRDEAYLADDLSTRFQQAGATTVVLVLDACRDNPFAEAGKRSLGGQAGLARMEPSEGVFVMYSAGAGQAAIDSLGPQDTDPNSIFTRSFLRQLERPGASVVEIAKATQEAVRDLAAEAGYVQTPAYYDQIIGTVRLNTAESAAAGQTQSFQEGQTVAMLPRLDPAPKAGKAQPLANFVRSGSGWMVSISLPEPATQFGYRVGEEGEFTDTGLSPNIDRDTGRPMPVTWFELPADQPAGMLYVTWRDKRGEEAGVFPIRFDPEDQLRASQKQILETTWTSWIAFREYNGHLLYFTHLLSYRCALEKVEYSIDDGPAETWPLGKCDTGRPYETPEGAEIMRKIPKGAKKVDVRVGYYDGTWSQKSFNVKF